MNFKSCGSLKETKLQVPLQLLFVVEEEERNYKDYVGHKAGD